jgi:hypothetical protein
MESGSEGAARSLSGSSFRTCKWSRTVKPMEPICDAGRCWREARGLMSRGVCGGRRGEKVRREKQRGGEGARKCGGQGWTERK